MEKALEELDLNLLKVFVVLLQEPNTTRVAEQLKMSQSAVSRALQRLREFFRMNFSSVLQGD